VSGRRHLDADAASRAAPQAERPARRWHSRAALATVAIADVASERLKLEAEHFSPAERAALAGRHVQSLAGRLALKRALCDLLGPECVGTRLAPCDFVILETAGGAPALGAVPGALSSAAAGPLGRLFVSISHTKARAVGLAVQESMLDGGGERARVERHEP